MSKKSSGSKSLFSTQLIVLIAIGWAFISLLFFLLFSDFIPTEGFPTWYGVVTYILEEVAFLGATILCLRNWRSSQIVSGRTVWLLLGMGMGSFFIGNLILAYWELILGKDADVSPGDIFFLLTYLFMGVGMLLAVLTRRLNLSVMQWATVAAIGIAGVMIAYYTSVAAPEELAIAPSGSPISFIAPAYATDAPAEPAPAAPEAAPTDAEPAAEETADPSEQPELEPVPIEAVENLDTAENVPDWALAAEAFLSPYADIIAWLYILGDILLLTMATMLLLAFWGGRFSTSWRFIAASAFSFYIADIWFNFAISYIPAYQTGALLEVFWIFSAVLVSIGAALEYDLSTRSRRTSRRRNIN